MHIIWKLKSEKLSEMYQFLFLKGFKYINQEQGLMIQQEQLRNSSKYLMIMVKKFKLFSINVIQLMLKIYKILTIQKNQSNNQVIRQNIIIPNLIKQQNQIERIKQQNHNNENRHDIEFCNFQRNLTQQTDINKDLYQRIQLLTNSLEQASTSMFENKRQLVDQQNQLSIQYFNRGQYMETQFNELKEQFQTTGKNQIYYKEIFDDMKVTLDLFKFEKKEIKINISQLQESVQFSVNQNQFSETIQEINTDYLKTYEQIRGQIRDSKKNIEELKLSLDSCYNNVNEISNKLSETYNSEIQSCLQELQIQQKSYGSLLQDHSEQIQQKQVYIQEQMQNLKKELIIQQNFSTQLIEKKIEGLIEKMEDLEKPQQEMIAIGGRKKSTTKEDNTPQSQKGKKISFDNSVELQQLEGISVQLQGIQDEIKEIQKNQFLPEFRRNFIEQVIQENQDEENIKEICKQQINISQKNFEDRLENSSIMEKLSNNVVKRIQFQDGMITQSQVDEILCEFKKMEGLKQSLKDTLDLSKQDNENLNQKFEKLYYKVNNLLSDQVINNEFMEKQIQNQSREKEEILAQIKQISLLLGMIGEINNISISLLAHQEIKNIEGQKTKGSEQLLSQMVDHNSQFKFFSLDDGKLLSQPQPPNLTPIGLIFDMGSLFDKQKKLRDQITYRGQTLEKIDLIKYSLHSSIQIWNQIFSESRFEEFKKYQPGSFFSAFVLNKISNNQGNQGASSSEQDISVTNSKLAFFDSPQKSVLKEQVSTNMNKQSINSTIIAYSSINQQGGKTSNKTIVQESSEHYTIQPRAVSSNKNTQNSITKESLDPYINQQMGVPDQMKVPEKYDSPDIRKQRGAMPKLNIKQSPKQVKQVPIQQSNGTSPEIKKSSKQVTIQKLMDSPDMRKSNRKLAIQIKKIDNESDLKKNKRHQSFYIKKQSSKNNMYNLESSISYSNKNQLLNNTIDFN